jgi:hypothetical protein
MWNVGFKMTKKAEDNENKLLKSGLMVDPNLQIANAINGFGVAILSKVLDI